MSPGMKGTAHAIGTLHHAPTPIGRWLGVAAAALMLGTGAASLAFFLVLGIGALVNLLR